VLPINLVPRCTTRANFTQSLTLANELGLSSFSDSGICKGTLLNANSHHRASAESIVFTHLDNFKIASYSIDSFLHTIKSFNISLDQCYESLLKC
jgi:hypothetical protein